MCVVLVSEKPRLEECIAFSNTNCFLNFQPSKVILFEIKTRKVVIKSLMTVH